MTDKTQATNLKGTDKTPATTLRGAAKRIDQKMRKNDSMTPLSVTGNFLFGHMKEMCAVTTFLLCWSRLGRDNFFAGPAVLYMVLLAYAGPVLNPLLFWALRLGPYMNNSESPDILTSDKFYLNKPFETGRLRSVLSLFLIPGFQIIGVAIAAACRQSFINSFGTETLSPGGTGASSLILYSDSRMTQSNTPVASAAALSLTQFSLSLPMQNSSMLKYNMSANTSNLLSSCTRATAYPYEKNNACLSGTGNWNLYYILEEAADTFFWCWILFFLFEQGEYKLEKESPNENEDENPTQSPAVLHALEIAIAAFGLNMMFPTAHHGWHITLYWYFLQSLTGFEWFTTNELNMRLIGAVIGLLVAMMFYYALDVLQMMSAPRDPKTVFSNAKPNTWLYAKIDQRIPTGLRSAA